MLLSSSVVNQTKLFTTFWVLVALSVSHLTIDQHAIEAVWTFRGRFTEALQAFLAVLGTRLIKFTAAHNWGRLLVLLAFPRDIWALLFTRLLFTM